MGKYFELYRVRLTKPCKEFEIDDAILVDRDEIID